jgi:hypothetical protein
MSSHLEIMLDLSVDTIWSLRLSQGAASVTELAIVHELLHQLH